MRLTTLTDYCLCVLTYVAVRDGGPVTIDDIAGNYGISRNHVMKVVRRLGQLGYLATVRGRGGGMKLARPAGEIGFGALIRETEQSFAPVQRFRPDKGSCAIAPACELRGVLDEAPDAFFAVLDAHTLADLVERRRHLAGLLRAAARD